jgi:hypothetical protein
LGLGLTLISARAATQIPLELRDLSNLDKARTTQERARRLQKEQAAAALLADRHQKAVRHFLIAGVNARAQQRAAEISRQLGPTEVLIRPVRRPAMPQIIWIVLLVAGVFFFRWRRSRAG